MLIASPVAGGGQRVATAPLLPLPRRFEWRTMQDRSEFMRKYDTYIESINAIQTRSAAFAMPVGACVETRTKRMFTRYTFQTAPHLVTEQ
ncbi:hypothetical protein PybrP1_007998 [[Pythium] brassicae (nom. inval.)]|nr:hypothetical protein PybrP1_007998 [[Pythium] brassicae (nom. inval.)]